MKLCYRVKPVGVTSRFMFTIVGVLAIKIALVVLVGVVQFLCIDTLRWLDFGNDEGEQAVLLVIQH